VSDLDDLDGFDDIGPPEELGPVDYLVVELPGDRVDGAIAPQLDDLVDQGLIRVLDMLVVRRRLDGAVETVEVCDLGHAERGRLHADEPRLAMLLGADDVAAIAAVIEPGCTAAVLVWENRWAVPFARAVRAFGGQLVASGRIPTGALLAGVQDDGRCEAPGHPERRTSTRSPDAAVLGSGPVARTVASRSVATAVARAVDRRTT
jgi:hypothetical protein